MIVDQFLDLTFLRKLEWQDWLNFLQPNLPRLLDETDEERHISISPLVFVNGLRIIIRLWLVEEE